MPRLGRTPRPAEAHNTLTRYRRVKGRPRTARHSRILLAGFETTTIRYRSGPWPLSVSKTFTRAQAAVGVICSLVCQDGAIPLKHHP